MERVHVHAYVSQRSTHAFEWGGWSCEWIGGWVGGFESAMGTLCTQYLIHAHHSFSLTA
jgi:hypothetical protein